MSSVDDLFRRPNAIPKRKLEDPTSTFSRQSSKSAKLSNGSSPHASKSSNALNGKGSLKQPESSGGHKTALVEDEVLDEEEIEAGPSLPPEDLIGEDEETAAEIEDEEGRFFGGGVSKQEKEVLDFIEQNETGDGDYEEKIDSAWIRRTAINFEKKINKNAELRAKYEADPMKFVGSEADLDTEIKSLSVLSEHGELYTEFVKMGCVGSLVGLLAHENTDIAIAVCELLAELTDEDANTTDNQWRLLVDAMVASDVLDLLVSNLTRLDEVSNENDRSGVYHVLSVIENLLSQPENIEKIGANNRMMQWLIARIKKPDADARGKVGQNRQYSAELLAILLQGNRKNRDRFADKGAVDILLELLSKYRKQDPEKDSDEEEFVENLFDCLTCSVEEQEAATVFLEGEGIELCLIMLREGRLSKLRALKVLDHAMGGKNAVSVCDRVVEAAGLKTLFAMLVKRKKLESTAVEHLIGIFASLLRYTPADSPARIRTLAKFVEKSYEKIDRLMELRIEYQARVGKVDADIDRERRTMKPEDIVDVADEWLSRRLDAGLFSLQTLDVILSWLVAEDDGARNKIESLLLQGGLKVLADSLSEQLEGIDTEGVEDSGGNSAKDMLEALLRCLQ